MIVVWYHSGQGQGHWQWLHTDASHSKCRVSVCVCVCVKCVRGTRSIDKATALTLMEVAL